MWLASIYVHIAYIAVAMTIEIYNNLSTYNESGNIKDSDISLNSPDFLWFSSIVPYCTSSLDT